MSKADKMFEELGYEKGKNLFGNLLYTQPGTSMNTIWFDEETKKSRNNAPFELSKEMKKAIHEKMKELGWIDDV